MTGRTLRLLHISETSSRLSCTFWVLHHWPNMHEIPASIDLGGIEIIDTPNDPSNPGGS